MPAPTDGPAWRLVGWLWLLGLSAVVLLTFRDYGIAWDEPLQEEYGRRVVRYYASLGADTTYKDYFDMYDNHGALFELVVRLVSPALPASLERYQARHLVTGLWSVLGVAATLRLGARLGGERAGVLSAVALTLMPTWYGHGFNNPKDLPFAVPHTFAVLVLAGALHESPLRKRTVVLLGLGCGLTLGMRVAGMILLVYVAVFLAAATWLASRGAPAPVLRRAGWRLARDLGGVLLVAWLVMLICWPWSQEAPIRNVIRGLSESSRFAWVDTVRYLGADVPAQSLPWHYLPVWLAMQLPEATGAAVLLGVGRAAVAALHRRARPAPWWLGRALLATALAVPILVAIARRPVIYDGARHFLFLLPLLAVVAALGADWLLGCALASHHLAARRAVPAALVVAALLEASTLVRLHPYEYVYFNRLVGGLRGAAGRFETDYWGVAFREAIARFSARVRADEGPAARPYRVFSCDPDSAFGAAHDLPVGFLFEPRPEAADFALVHERWGCAARFRGRRRLAVVERDGVPLAEVFDLRAAPGATAADKPPGAALR